MTTEGAGGVSRSLSQRSLRAVFWSGGERFTTQGLRFAVTLVLARLLAPEDFGAIAVLHLFIGLGSIVIDSGFGSALIQRQNTTVDDESTVFYFNLGVGALVALLLVAFSWQIAAFFELPVLQPLACLMALNLLLGALKSIHSILLTKALNFRIQMKVNVVAATLSGVVAVVMAWRGFGVWSLAAQALMATVVTVLLLWSWHPWRPVARFSLASLRTLFSFGGYMLLSGLLDTVSSRLHTVIIGRMYSPRSLGFFSRAETTQQIPADLLASILGRVAFPAFSATANDPARLARGARRALTGIMILNIPAMVGLAVVADPLIRVLFGEKWTPSIPYLQILCFSGIFWPLHVINLNVLMAQGRSRLFFQLEVAKAVLGVVALVAASLHSVMAIAWSWVLMGFVYFLLNAFYTGRFLGYGAVRQTLDVLPYVAVAGLMAACIWPISFSTTMPPVAVLGLQVAAGAALYVGVCRLLKLGAFADAWALVTRELGLLTKRPAAGP